MFLIIIIILVICIPLGIILGNLVSRKPAVTPSNNTSTSFKPYVNSNLQSISVVDFLVYGESFAGEGPIWWINTSGNQIIGNFYLTGVNAGTCSISGTIKYLQELQAKGVKIICSIGGSSEAGLIATLKTIDDASNFALSFAYALLGINTNNPLSWTRFGDNFFFDGYDFDIEGNSTIPEIFSTISGILCTKAPNKIATMATQTPQFFDGNACGLNGNGSWYPYSTTTITDLVDQFNKLPDTFNTSLIHPQLLKNFNYVFIQLYNQGSGWYIGDSTFEGILSGCAYTILKSNSNCRIILGLGSSDTNPIWDINLSEQLNTSINNINNLIKSQTEYKNCKITDWLAGAGFWNSPTGNSSIKNIYSDKKLINLPTKATMLYLDASKGSDPKWKEDLPIVVSR